LAAFRALLGRRRWGNIWGGNSRYTPQLQSAKKKSCVPIKTARVGAPHGEKKKKKKELGEKGSCGSRGRGATGGDASFYSFSRKQMLIQVKPPTKRRQFEEKRVF